MLLIYHFSTQLNCLTYEYFDAIITRCFQISRSFYMMTHKVKYSLLELTQKLHNFLLPNSAIFMRCSPEIEDFTSTWEGNIVLCGKQGEFEFQLDKSSLQQLAYLLGKYLFSSKDRCIITWNIKNLFTYFKYNLSKKCENYLPTCPIVDLKYGEAFLGIRQPPPKNLGDAIKRCQAFIKNPSWNKVAKLVYLPLSFKVLPQIETMGVLDQNEGKVVYPSYEIEGQINGRLRCESNFENAINPHTLSLQQRRLLLPRGGERDSRVFIELDYKHLEGSMIQWLTKDKALEEDIASGDLYSGVYKRITNKECQGDQRRKEIKVIFLATMFGSKPYAISKSFSMPLTIAEKIYYKIEKKYSTAMDWLLSKQNDLASNSLAIDCFGRCRSFIDKPHRRRNSEVQGPAAILCLEKLVQLHKHLSNHVIFHIHDSYVLVSPLDTYKSVIEVAKSILEAPSQFCDGLQLKISCKVGKRLSDMEEYQ